MEDIAKIASSILLTYELAVDEAATRHLFARKYGKKAEQLETKKIYNEALAVVIAVDEALTEIRIQLAERVTA